MLDTSIHKYVEIRYININSLQYKGSTDEMSIVIRGNRSGHHSTELKMQSHAIGDNEQHKATKNAGQLMCS